MTMLATSILSRPIHAAANTILQMVFFRVPLLIVLVANGHPRPLNSVVVVTALTVVFVQLVASTVEAMLRTQFLETKVAAHFDDDRAAAIEAQEVVLTAAMPRHIVKDLRAWLASALDPSKMIVRSYDTVVVAFVAMQPAGAVEADCARDWRVPASKLVDRALAVAVHGAAAVKSLPESPSRSLEASANSVSRSLEASANSPASPGTTAATLADTLQLTEVQESTLVKIKSLGDSVLLAGPFGPAAEVGASPGDTLRPALEALLRFLRLASTVDDLRELMPLAAAGAPDLTLSCGAHVGAVTSGVLGSERLAFDVFGDCVNTASRTLTAPRRPTGESSSSPASPTPAPSPSQPPPSARWRRLACCRATAHPLTPRVRPSSLSARTASRATSARRCSVWRRARAS